MVNHLISNVLRCGGVGCLIFTAFIFFISYTGIAAEMRDEEGKFRKRKNFKTFFGATIFLTFLLGILYFGNLNLIKSTEESPGLLVLWINSFGIFFIIHLYDLIVLDYLIIVKWHPKFLKLPDTNYYRTMEPHLHGFVRGIPLGLIASFIVSMASAVFN